MGRCYRVIITASYGRSLRGKGSTRKARTENRRKERKMKRMMKKTVALAAACVMGGAANALTSEEIANVLGIDPNIATFSLGGVSEWSVDTNSFHSGNSALKSGFINNSSSTFQSSDLVMTIDVKEASRLTYWFRVSCYDYDY